VRDQRRDPAHGWLQGGEAHPRDQQGQGRADRGPRGLCRHRRPRGDRPGRRRGAAQVTVELLADKAYYSIRDLIVSLELPPGSVLHEAALQERLGVGRTPVREALRRLAQEKL